MRGRAAAALVVIAAVAAPAGPASAVAGASSAPVRAGAEEDVDRPVRDARVGEASGLAVSPQHPGVLWTHDDSGNPPLLFALGRDGRVTGMLRLRGTADVDWEAVAAFRDVDGRALLAVGDLGDNRGDRREVEVDVVAEPGRLRAAGDAVTPVLRLLLTYPDRAADAETLLVDTARHRMFVVTKGLFGGSVYAVPASAWNGSAPRRPTVRSARLVRVGTVPLGLVTDGTVAPGGAVLLRTYTLVAAFAPLPLEAGDGGLAPVASQSLPLQRQGEGLALAPDGRSVLLSSEGAGEPVLRVALSSAVRAGLSASAPTGGTASGGASPQGSPPPPSPARRTPSPASAAAGSTTTSSGAGGGLPWAALLLAAGVVGAVAVGLARSRR